MVSNVLSVTNHEKLSDPLIFSHVKVQPRMDQYYILPLEEQQPYEEKICQIRCTKATIQVEPEEDDMANQLSESEITFRLGCMTGEFIYQEPGHHSDI